MTEPFKVPTHVMYHGDEWVVTRKNENQVTLMPLGFKKPRLTWGLKALEMAIAEKRMEATE